MKKLTFVLLAFTLLLNSCMVNRHTVGDGPVGKKGSTLQYSKAKQPYLFWGLIALGNSNPAAPQSGNYQIKTSYNFWDGFVSMLTGGIFSMRTVRILVKPGGNAEAPVEMQPAALNE